MQTMKRNRLKDCEKVNDAIMEPLDNADYIKEQYFQKYHHQEQRMLRKDETLRKEQEAKYISNYFKR